MGDESVGRRKIFFKKLLTKLRKYDIIYMNLKKGVLKMKIIINNGADYHYKANYLIQKTIFMYDSQRITLEHRNTKINHYIEILNILEKYKIDENNFIANIDEKDIVDFIKEIQEIERLFNKSFTKKKEIKIILTFCE